MTREPPKGPADQPVESADTVAAVAEGDAAMAPTVTPDDAMAPTVTPDTSMAVTETPMESAPRSGSLGPRAVELASSPLEERGFLDRYSIDRMLGRGGMGEVRTCRDARVGRDVAIKSMRRKSAGEALARFVREARVQGQLEHPAIVPVYDIGIDPNGDPYFTMKRLRGMTLEQILRGLAEGDAAMVESYPLRKLLGVFVSVCQAMEYAHSRGVLHRDLKPSNIMLGDFGEVYLLDWGVARVAGSPDPDAGDPAAGDALVASGGTAHGAVMGTPGYMAPEQLEGRTDDVDERADVYSLGAVLFELLTLEPLHARQSAQSIVESTLRGTPARPSARAADRDVPPELDDACARATARARDQRFESVAVMREAVERYLDGDRDLERRRVLADEHAALASQAAEATLVGRDAASRKTALREAGRALALDPENGVAASVMSRLMLEPPEVVPDEVEAALDDSLRVASQHELRGGTITYAAHFISVPFLLWLGVKDWSVFFALGGVCTLLGIWTWIIYKTGRLSALTVHAAALGNLGLLLLMSRMFGSLIMIPAIATVGTLGFLYHRNQARLWSMVAIGCAAIVLPVALEAMGVMGTTYTFMDGHMVVTSQLLELPRTATVVSLVFFTCTTLIASAFFITNTREAQVRAERQVHLQAWQLRQLVPETSSRESAR